MTPCIAVDVDLTLVDSLTPWTKWWEEKTGATFPWDKIGPELSINDALQLEMPREETVKYWLQDDLYDNLKPHAGSIQTLKFLSFKYDVFFVSHCQDEHLDSKLRFLDKFFPFHSGLINTQNKAGIEADMYFDDHVAFTKTIVEKRPNAKIFQFVTRDNEYQLVKGAVPMKSWETFLDELYFA